jgi:hypothetical protein
MQIASAMPRRRVNHSEVSATSGAKVAEVPNKPISTPCARLNCHSELAEPAATKPSPSPKAPTNTGAITPKRSARRPIRMPPNPKPTMVSVYGNEASARAAPNSVCMAGSTTVTQYMPTPPMVISASDTMRRSHA